MNRIIGIISVGLIFITLPSQAGFEFFQKWFRKSDSDVIFSYHIGIIDLVTDDAIDFNTRQSASLELQFKRQGLDAIYLKLPDEKGRTGKYATSQLIYEGRITRVPLYDNMKLPAEVAARTSVHVRQSEVDFNDVVGLESALIGIREGILYILREGRERVRVTFLPQAMPEMTAVESFSVPTEFGQLRVISIRENGKSFFTPDELRASVLTPEEAEHMRANPTPRDAGILRAYDASLDQKPVRYRVWLVQEPAGEGVLTNSHAYLEPELNITLQRLKWAGLENGALKLTPHPPITDEFVRSGVPSLKRPYSISLTHLKSVRKLNVVRVPVSVSLPSSERRGQVIPFPFRDTCRSYFL